MMLIPLTFFINPWSLKMRDNGQYRVGDPLKYASKHMDPNISSHFVVK